MSDADLQARLLKARLATAAASLEPAATSQSPTPDAQGVINLPDGTRMVFNPATGQYTSADLMAGNMKPGIGMSALSGAANGVTLGWGDELAGSLGATPLGVERGRATQMAAQRDHPIVNGLASAAGNVAAIAPAMEAAPAGLLGGSSIAGQSASGVVLGGSLGALQGAGDAPAGSKEQGAANGAMFGGALGGGAPMFAAGLRNMSAGVINYLRSSDIAGIQSALNIGADAARIIKAHLSNDDPAAAVAALNKAGSGAMLADSSPQASQLLDTTVAAGGPSQRIARDAVEGRSAAASGRLTTAMDSVLGPAPDGIKTASRDIAQRTAASRKAAYDAAYSAPIDYASTQGQAIEGVISRIPTKTVNAAIQEANDAMKAEGIKNMQIMAHIGPDGSVTFTNPPNVQQLDYLKKALDGIARDATDPITGKITGEGMRAGKLASDLRSAVANAVPDYSRAVKLGGDKIAEEKALQIGRDLLKDGTTRETVAQTMFNSSVEAKIAAKRGVRIAFDEAMSNVKAVASDPNIDARAAMDAVKKFSSPAARQKAEIILGKAQAGTLFDAFDEAAKQLALRTAVSRNSATAARTAGKTAMDAIINGPLQLFKQGQFGKASQGLIQILTKSTPADRIQHEQEIYGEVARALTGQKGAAAQAALQTVIRALQGTPATQAQARMVANTVTKLVTAGAYQGLSQGQKPSGSVMPGQPQ